ncbi:hypothetical protein SAMN06273567_10761 [Geodermatophilus aquaeductus]|uniref:Uncharacterized protein n=1 Tax=Geodermatophilus aquaeductus TaxID=1564161 RepID=A0A521F5H2_9ACTN|nr:hypothetical protein SAMN06273567_10761 [Geodermatophilus aquaeductus]
MRVPAPIIPSRVEGAGTVWTQLLPAVAAPIDTAIAAP